MKHRVHAAHRRAHGGWVEQAESGSPGGEHLVPFGLRERPERPSENTGSSGDKQTHGISFLKAKRPLQRAAGMACLTSVGRRMLGPGDRGNDERVKILMSLDATDPPVGRVRVIRCPAAGLGSPPGREEDEELRFTGWLGLLRVLYEVMGAATAREPAREMEES